MSTFSGIVLAGGKSVRMYRDKRFLQLNNETLLDISVNRMRRVTDDVVVVLGRTENLNIENITIAVDTTPDTGPLIGIISGMIEISTDYAIVTPVDTPLLPAEFLEYMKVNSTGYDIVVPLWEKGIEPLVAVYSARLVKYIKNRAESVRKMAPYLLIKELDNNRVRYITENEIRCFGNPETMFININTIDDFYKAEKILEQG